MQQRNMSPVIHAPPYHYMTPSTSVDMPSRCSNDIWWHWLHTNWIPAGGSSAWWEREGDVCYLTLLIKLVNEQKIWLPMETLAWRPWWSSLACWEGCSCSLGRNFPWKIFRRAGGTASPAKAEASHVWSAPPSCSIEDVALPYDSGENVLRIPTPWMMLFAPPPGFADDIIASPPSYTDDVIAPPPGYVDELIFSPPPESCKGVVVALPAESGPSVLCQPPGSAEGRAATFGVGFMYM